MVPKATSDMWLPSPHTIQYHSSRVTVVVEDNPAHKSLAVESTKWLAHTLKDANEGYHGCRYLLVPTQLFAILATLGLFTRYRKAAAEFPNLRTLVYTGQSGSETRQSKQGWILLSDDQRGVCIEMVSQLDMFHIVHSAQRTNVRPCSVR